MKKYEKAISYIIGVILIYLALAALRCVISFLLRYWILLLALIAAVYALCRYCKAGNNPWWLVKLKALYLRIKSKVGAML